MKALLGILFFVPLMICANEAAQDKTYAQFRHLCVHGESLQKREMYCKLAKDHLKAMEIYKDLSQK